MPSGLHGRVSAGVFSQSHHSAPALNVVIAVHPTCFRSFPTCGCFFSPCFRSSLRRSRQGSYAEDDQEEEEDQVDDEEFEDDVVTEDEDEEEDASQLGMLQANRTLSSANARGPPGYPDSANRNPGGRWRLRYFNRCYWTASLKNLEINVLHEGRSRARKFRYTYQWSRPAVRLRFKNKKNQDRATHWRKVKVYRFLAKGNNLCVRACMESKRMRNRFHWLVKNDPRGIAAVKC